MGSPLPVDGFQRGPVLGLTSGLDVILQALTAPRGIAVRCDEGVVGQEFGVGGLRENAIDALLRVVTLGGQSVFMTRYVTTIGSRIYLPSEWIARPPVDRYCVMRHEAVHLAQFRRFGWLGMSVLYVLLPLPCMFAGGRAWLELRHLGRRQPTRRRTSCHRVDPHGCARRPAAPSSNRPSTEARGRKKTRHPYSRWARCPRLARNACVAWGLDAFGATMCATRSR